MLLQYAREHHFPNPTFFVDDGVSGVTYDRPGFQAMLAEIEAGRVAVAIAKDLSRLGRNSALTGLYTNFTFPQNGVRFIAINDNYDTIDPNRVDNDFAGIKNWFNEFYARDTSRKIRAVQKAKGERGVPLTTNVPYGYVKDLENPRRWVVDPVAADVVKRIFDLCMKGRGPMQIANQLKADKVLTPSAYRALQGIKTPNKKPEDPCDWHSSTVVAILERREYTGCTVNFKTYTNSIWDKKQRDNPLEKQAIFPNTHEVIIEGAVFEKVWSYVDGKPILNQFQTETDIPAKTALSDQISKDLKKLGFKFVGSTIIYAYMQAIGIVNDHVKGCHLYANK